MDPASIAIILMIIGLILLIIEALTPGFFAVIPGAILMVIGILGYFVDGYFDNPLMLVVTVIIVAFLVSILTVKFYQMLAKPEPPETTVTESMVGKTGIITVKTDPNSIKGKVKVGSDTWSATSDEVIEKGTEVIIYAGEGVHVRVRPKE
jgi:Membrane protein implicated in regulation of membrane protease activity